MTERGIFYGKYLLLGTSALMLLAALFFEHVMGLQPCVNCVYQRLGVLTIIIGAALLLPASTWRAALPGGLIILTGCGYAAYTSFEHIRILANTNPFISTCEFSPTFPFSAPLDAWLPWLFKANGPCDIAGQWSWFGISMPEFVFIYSIYAAFAALALVIFMDRQTSR